MYIRVLANFQTLFWKDGWCNDESPSHIGKVVTFIVITNYIGLNRLLVTTTFQNYLYSQPPASVALPVTVGATDNCIAPHTSHLMWENKTFKGRPYVFLWPSIDFVDLGILTNIIPQKGYQNNTVRERNGLCSITMSSDTLLFWEFWTGHLRKTVWRE